MKSVILRHKRYIYLSLLRSWRRVGGTGWRMMWRGIPGPWPSHRWRPSDAWTFADRPRWPEARWAGISRRTSNSANLKSIMLLLIKLFADVAAASSHLENRNARFDSIHGTWCQKYFHDFSTIVLLIRWYHRFYTSYLLQYIVLQGFQFDLKPYSHEIKRHINFNAFYGVEPKKKCKHKLQWNFMITTCLDKL